jgi:hypothetical protein
MPEFRMAPGAPPRIAHPDHARHALSLSGKKPDTRPPYRNECSTDLRSGTVANAQRCRVRGFAKSTSLLSPVLAKAVLLSQVAGLFLTRLLRGLWTAR